MEYYDEIERMRNRRKSGGHKGAGTQRPDGRSSSGYAEDNLADIELDMVDWVHKDPPRQQRDFGHTSHNSGQQRRSGHKGGQRSKTNSSKAAKRRRKRRFLIIEFAVLFILVIGVFFFVKDRTTGYWTVAIFGVDSRDGNTGAGTLSDVEMLCVLDRKTGEIKLVSVFRDTYLQIDDEGTYHKINEAYLKGGHKQAVAALERNLDLKIDDYATFNWKSVADAINILGGIDLEITDNEFKQINSFITATVEYTGIGSHHLEQAGMNHLDGVQAVAYARLRLMDTDYKRTARQRKVISLAMEKAKQANFADLNNILVTVLPQISTSIGIDDLLPMVKNLGDFHIGTTDGFPFARGEARIDRRSCVIPLTLESNVVQLHQILYGIENYQPSSAVKKISDRIAKDSGMGEAAENAPKVEAGGGSGSPPAQPQQTTPAETPAETVTQPETSEEETTEVPAEDVSESSSTEIGPGMETESTKPAESEPPVGPGENSVGPGETPSGSGETSAIPGGTPMAPGGSSPDSMESGDEPGSPLPVEPGN